MYNRKPIKKIAVIHDLCTLGKAALTNVIPILSVMGFEVCPIPTMLLSTHTGGFKNPSVLKTESYLKEVTKHYKVLNIEFDAILIGYIGDISLIDDVLNFINTFKKENTKVILDPIFADNGVYYKNFDSSYMNNIKKLICVSDIITPNYTEACYLSSGHYIPNPTRSDLESILNKLNCNNVVVTSVINNDSYKICTLLYENQCLKEFYTNRLKKSYPGTGDIFVSTLLGYLLRGENLTISTKKSVDFVFKIIDLSNKYDYETKYGVLLEHGIKMLI